MTKLAYPSYTTLRVISVRYKLGALKVTVGLIWDSVCFLFYVYGNSYSSCKYFNSHFTCFGEVAFVLGGTYYGCECWDLENVFKPAICAQNITSRT